MSSLRVAMRLSLMEPASSECKDNFETSAERKKWQDGENMTRNDTKTNHEIPRSSSTEQEKTSGRPNAAGKKRSSLVLSLPPRPKIARRACSGLADVESTNRASLQMLASLITEGKQVVAITGAGLSCASGIPPFRASRAGSSSDAGAIWSANVEAMGTRTSFLRDPRHWYTSFWLPAFSPAKMRRVPNAGHRAVAAMCEKFPNLRIVTQNVDGLHNMAAAALKGVSEVTCSRLIEAHGRVGLYKCSSALREDGGTCRYASEESIKPEDFPDDATRRQLGHGVDVPEPMASSHPPRCPSCRVAPCLPQALLFDEDYTDHEFYQFEKMQAWFNEADALMFVGTSFAVTLTSLAVEEGRVRKLPMFNFNIDGDPERTSRPTLLWHDIVGRAENTLPLLLSMANRRRDEGLTRTAVETTAPSHEETAPTSESESSLSTSTRLYV